MLGSANYNIRMYSVLLKHSHRVLCWFGLELFCSAKVWHKCKVYNKTILIRKFPLQLTNSLHKRKRLNVTHGSSKLCYNDIVFAGFTQKKHSSLDFVCNVRNNLDSFSQICTFALLVNHRSVNSSGCDIVCLRSENIQKSFVMTEVEVSFCPVFSYIALTMFIRV